MSHFLWGRERTPEHLEIALGPTCKKFDFFDSSELAELPVELSTRGPWANYLFPPSSLFLMPMSVLRPQQISSLRLPLVSNSKRRDKWRVVGGSAALPPQPQNSFSHLSHTMQIDDGAWKCANSASRFCANPNIHIFYSVEAGVKDSWQLVVVVAPPQWRLILKPKLIVPRSTLSDLRLRPVIMSLMAHLRPFQSRKVRKHAGCNESSHTFWYAFFLQIWSRCFGPSPFFFFFYAFI